MITYQRDRLSQALIDEAAPILELHYQELTLHKESIKLAPMWERYAMLEKAGSFVLFTAKEDGKLIGYSAFFITNHVHYEATKVASNDVLYLHPEHRKGSTGIKLIRLCERELSAMGVNKITWHAKMCTSLIPILNRMGYGAEEVILGKILQGDKHGI